MKRAAHTGAAPGNPWGRRASCQRQQRGGLAVWVWGGTVVSTWVT